MVAATPASGGREQAPAGRRAAPGAAPAARPAELTSRERRERALLAMCIAIPDEGREYLARLTDAHLSPTGLRAAAWLREHPEDPASNLPHDDGELAGLIAELVIMSREEPASHEAMELNFLLLEQRRLEDEIAAAGERGDYERRAALSRERAALVQRIAHAERPGGQHLDNSVCAFFCLHHLRRCSRGQGVPRRVPGRGNVPRSDRQAGRQARIDGQPLAEEARADGGWGGDACAEAEGRTGDA